MPRPATARRPAPVVGGNAVLCVPHALNSPLNYTDPTGHCVEPITATVVCIPTTLFVGAALTVAYVGFVIYDFASPTFNPRDDFADAATDALTELYDNIKYAASGGNQASSELIKQLAGNVATSPGDFNPNDFNRNPHTGGEWRSGQGYRDNYEDAYGVTRDSANYELHHILPQEYRETMRQAGINIDHPAFLREVRITDPVTNVRVHQRLYTDVWADWRAGLGHNPMAQEIINFARSLEEQYSLEGTLFYRQGPGLPGPVFTP